MNCYCGLFEDHADTAHMTEDELFDYAVDRMHVMLKLERMAERHLAQKDTPMQRWVLEMAHRRVAACEAKYGIKRSDPALW